MDWIQVEGAPQPFQACKWRLNKELESMMHRKHNLKHGMKHLNAIYMWLIHHVLADDYNHTFPVMGSNANSPQRKQCDNTIQIARSLCTTTKKLLNLTTEVNDMQSALHGPSS